MQTNQQINGSDNDTILTQMLAQKVRDARYKRSARKVLDELGIEVLQ